MKVIVDTSRCVFLPGAQAGDTFDMQIAEDGKLILTLLHSAQEFSTTAKIEKRSGFSVGVLDHPIDDKALAAELNEFP